MSIGDIGNDLGKIREHVTDQATVVKDSRRQAHEGYEKLRSAKGLLMQALGLVEAAGLDFKGASDKLQTAANTNFKGIAEAAASIGLHDMRQEAAAILGGAVTEFTMQSDVAMLGFRKANGLIVAESGGKPLSLQLGHIITASVGRIEEEYAIGMAGIDDCRVASKSALEAIDNFVL